MVFSLSNPQRRVDRRVDTHKKIVYENKFNIKEVKKLNLDETGVEPMTSRLQGERATNYATRPKYTKLVPSRIELLILALLAPRLNQLGQGTIYGSFFFTFS